MSELVTGDAVVLGLRPARLPSRALAVFIDLVLAWTAYIVLSLVLLTATASLDAAALAAVQVALFLLVLVGVPIAVETLSHGRSLGKLACGLRVVQDDGGPIRFRHALVRGAIGVVEIQLFVGVIACVASLVSARGRRLGDVFAGTLVVRERVPTPRAVRVPPPPPWLVGQFRELDLSRVPDRLWLAVRQYLMRAGQLDAAVAESMARRLAADVVAYTGAPAPQDVPAAAYLAGVVAERQARDAQRAFGPGTAYGVAPGTGQVPAPGGVGPGLPERPAGPPATRGGFAPPGGERPAGAAVFAPAPGDARDRGNEAAPEPRTGFVPPA
ncbi:RDD family protein [Streptomyces armeniacus]|uniref:RDD family protein n=1 Tax=Streptomyces armeniacus TaxID=83291 RepID=A0A345XQG7_9ACTN|nr:RDD family protein [Streptomyces armeniacus]AXK33883.1 RDD family protein [Streptomyces armeniacus]